MAVRGRQQCAMNTRFRIAAGAIACVFVPALPAALAQDFPTRVVRIILPFAPGGGTDVFARVLAVRLQEAAVFFNRAVDKFAMVVKIAGVKAQ